MWLRTPPCLRREVLPRACNPPNVTTHLLPAVAKVIISQKAPSSQNPLRPHVGWKEERASGGWVGQTPRPQGLPWKLALEHGVCTNPNGGSTGTKRAPDIGLSAAARLLHLLWSHCLGLWTPALPSRPRTRNPHALGPIRNSQWPPTLIQDKPPLTTLG